MSEKTKQILKEMAKNAYEDGLYDEPVSPDDINDIIAAIRQQK